MVCFLIAHSHPALTRKPTREEGAGRGGHPKRDAEAGAVLPICSSRAAGWVGCWAAKGAKSQSAHLLKVPRTQGEGNPFKRMKTETHFLHYPIRALALNSGPLSGKHFPGFQTIISFPAPRAKTCISFTSPQTDAGTPGGLVSSCKSGFGPCRSSV